MTPGIVLVTESSCKARCRKGNGNKNIQSDKKVLDRSALEALPDTTLELEGLGGRLGAPVKLFRVIAFRLCMLHDPF